MSHNLVESAFYTADIPVPDPGDERKTVSIVPAFQALANRTKLHNNFYQVMVGTGGVQDFTVTGRWAGTQRFLNTAIFEGVIESYGGVGIVGTVNIAGLATIQNVAVSNNLTVDGNTTLGTHDTDLFTVKSYTRLEGPTLLVGPSYLLNPLQCSGAGRVQTVGVIGTPGASYSMTTTHDIFFPSGSLGGVPGTISILNDANNNDEITVTTEDANTLNVTNVSGPSVVLEYVVGGVRSVRFKKIAGVVRTLEMIKWT